MWYNPNEGGRCRALSETWEMRVIARAHNDYTGKFGIPRQSGLVSEVLTRIVFEPEYRVPEALRGIEGFSHLWLIWVFDQAEREGWSPTIRPPRLGGNTRVGVFASRSPYRPNPIGLSSVRLVGVERTADAGLTLVVSGADLADGTPILDVKPYLPYADAHAGEAGFTEALGDQRLEVSVPEELLEQIPEASRKGLLEVLSRDPRPGYQRTAGRAYGLSFAGMNIRFTVDTDRLTVTDVQPEEQNPGNPKA